ncbi:MAG: GNAT superfamily N-acetyltransferase [Marinoscillum sp.]|jgi:GNAT superfamily N-acetyltransferase
MKIRKGEYEDLSRALELIEELALYEKAPEEVTNTLEMMQEDGFGENPVFEFIVAEENGEIHGLSIFYWRYSTWKGKRIYLEDLIVTESQRGAGIGKLLFDETIAIGKASGATGMMWQVLDWNEPAINFYKKYYNAGLESGWLNGRLDF